MALQSPRFSRTVRLQKASENNPPMKPGEKGEAVAIVQQALVDLGFAMPITTGNGQKLADGIYGPETTSVVRKFQTTFGLAVDGVVGRQTLHKLDELITAFIAGKKAELAAHMALPTRMRDYQHRTLRRA